MENNVTRPSKGLSVDTSFRDQPKDSYRFALNAIAESEEGDLGFLSNEQSNEQCASLPAGYTPLGKVYIGNGETVVCLVKNDGTASEIGILNDNCSYTTYVNDLTTPNKKLNFNIAFQISITYRLRRGCERTIYFVDGYNPPRYFNLDKISDFKTLADFDAEKFKLFKTSSSVPVFSDITIETGGLLPPGSYNFAIQYLDEDLNPTEWITTTDTVIIYNDNIEAVPFAEVRGSTNVVNMYQDFGITGKVIQMKLSNLNTTFPFYRMAVIEANNGSGEVSRVLYSNERSTRSLVYIYSGEIESYTIGTVEEIAQFKTIIEKAQHIEQIENRLVLANVEGKKVNFCALQKYASKITADVKYLEVTLDSLQAVNNQKRGQVHTEKVGYMPGEIYSFGVVYLFADGSVSPEYHIPGKASGFPSGMSSNNILGTTQYLENETCDGISFWGEDSQGTPLTGTNVRHHRFPSRGEANKPLLTKTSTLTGGEAPLPVNSELRLDITGTIDPGDTRTDIEYIVSTLVDGYPIDYYGTFVAATYTAGVVGGVNPDFQDLLIASVPGTIVGIDVVEEVGGIPYEPSTGLLYTLRVIAGSGSISTIDDATYFSEIFGIEFSNIDKPTLADTLGEEVVGYYIVRSNRSEENKTILDSGVLTPLLIEKEETAYKFVSHGQLLPNSLLIQEDTFGLIHPEHKFNNKEYKSTTSYVKEGEFVVSSKNYSTLLTQDVMPGTSYDSTTNKRRERDSDGFTLNTSLRNNNVNYVKTAPTVLASGSEVTETFYLDTLFSKTITDTADERKNIYNLSGDNKIGIVQLNKVLPISTVTAKLPYVIMKRDLTDPYANFRSSTYYKETINPFLFSTDVGNTTGPIFNGDSYISSMKYVSSMMYQIVMRKRATKSGLFNFILGALAIILGVLIAIGTLGGGTALSIALISFGVSQISSGLKKDQLAKVYGDLYDLGLDSTVDDIDTTGIFKEGTQLADDEIQWFQDSITNLWFESSVNMNWRMGNTVGLTDFLDSPTAYNENQFKNYALEKVTILDAKADGGRNYQGFAKAELYELNKDYQRRDREKKYFPLGIEYDCCSNCNEEFPHRVFYSEQSFQEELTDNYRVFLGNNYRDIEGETGVITNLFRIQNNLYIHTEEALWHLPQSIQERVTGDIVSFIGTGSLFAIPPRKIVDDQSGHSAGTQHKWGMLKTPHGVFFPNERQAVIFQFDGNKLTPLYEGSFNWFKNNMLFKVDEDYYKTNGRRYPYSDNPSNNIGSGFTSVYDSRKERVIFSKKDFLFNSSTIDSSDYELCTNGSTITFFDNFQQTIATQAGLGKNYLGLENCRMKFAEITTTLIDTEVFVDIPNTADIHIFFDTSGSFDAPALAQIDTTINEWLPIFQASHPDWTGSLYKYNDSTERWVNYATTIGTITYGGVTADKDIVVISFCNEANSSYHGTTLTNPITTPTATYLNDVDKFLGTNSYGANPSLVNIFGSYKSFKGIHYPIAFSTLDASKEFILHSLAALKGIPYTLQEVDALPVNPGFTVGEWGTLKTALQGVNPYPNDGLENYNWLIKSDRYKNISGNVITTTQFTEDIEALLAGSSTTTIVQVPVSTIEYSYIDGVPLVNPSYINNSWTMSYSLKLNSWTSWHSYLPNFYIQTPNKFYSWKTGSGIVWKHNAQGNYQRFYGVLEPFIVEYVAFSDTLKTKMWDSLKLMTEAESFDVASEEFLEERFVTFNKLIAYNSRQCSGELELLVKDTLATPANYLKQQIVNNNDNSVIIDKNEKDWTINDLRDIRIDYTKPIWNSKLSSVQNEYFIDKVLNTSTLSVTKNWTQLESFRDKYLVVRLIFDTFDNIKLIFNYSVENENQSFR